MRPVIACVFHNKAALGCTAAALIASLQSYVSDYLRPAWNVDAELVERAPQDGDWVLAFADNADQAGTLGYHEAEDLISGYVFVKTAQEDKEPESLVSSHEVAEMLLDPLANKMITTPRGRVVAYEICDPVQAEWFTGPNLLRLSNFVLPGWFGGPPVIHNGKPFYDYLGTCQQPWEIRPGGYIPVYYASHRVWSIHVHPRGQAKLIQAYATRRRDLRRLHRRILKEEAGAGGGERRGDTASAPRPLVV